MNNHESAECVSKLLELFPDSDLQEAELELLNSALRRFPLQDGLDVIKTHRLNNDTKRPKFKVIIGALYERQRQNIYAPRAESLTYIETLRAMVVGAHSTKAARIKDMKKEELATRIGRGWWISCSAPIVPGYHEGDRATAWPNRADAIIREVFLMLSGECDIEDGDALACAQACVADEPTYQNYLNSAMAQPELIPT